MDLAGKCGGQCEADGCGTFDFLLTHCHGCGGRYCQAHAAAGAAHGCATVPSPPPLSPPPSPPVEREAADAGDAKGDPCFVCDVSHFAVMPCDGCKRPVCLAHRFHADHASRPPPLPVHPLRAAVQLPSANPSAPGGSRARPLLLGRATGSAVRVYCTAMRIISASPLILSDAMHLSIAKNKSVGNALDALSAVLTETGQAGAAPPLLHAHALWANAAPSALDRAAELSAALPPRGAVIVVTSDADAVRMMEAHEESNAALPAVMRKAAGRFRPPLRPVDAEPEATAAPAATVPPVPQAPAPPATVGDIDVFDDAAAPTPSLLLFAFGSSRMKPAVSSVGAVSTLGGVALVVAFPLLPQTEASPRVAQWVKVGAGVSVGRLFDVLMSALGIPSGKHPNVPPEERLGLFDLKRLVPLTDVSAKCGAENGSAYAVVRGHRLPQSAAAELAGWKQHRDDKTVPLKLKMQLLKIGF
jgi:hypothetical protein